MNQHRDGYLYETLTFEPGQRLKATSVRPVTIEFYTDHRPFPQSGHLLHEDIDELTAIVNVPFPGKWTIVVPHQGHPSPETVLAIV